jgi:hypothetical protein
MREGQHQSMAERQVAAKTGLTYLIKKFGACKRIDKIA